MRWGRGDLYQGLEEYKGRPTAFRLLLSFTSLVLLHSFPRPFPFSHSLEAVRQLSMRVTTALSVTSACASFLTPLAASAPTSSTSSGTQYLRAVDIAGQILDGSDLDFVKRVVKTQCSHVIVGGGTGAQLSISLFLLRLVIDPCPPPQPVSPLPPVSLKTRSSLSWSSKLEPRSPQRRASSFLAWLARPSAPTSTGLSRRSRRRRQRGDGYCGRGGRCSEGRAR